QAVRGFDERVPEGDRGAAVPAVAEQKRVAQERDVVPRRDGGAAVGTTRAGRDDGLAEGQAVDADVGEAAHDEAQGEGGHRPQGRLDRLLNREATQHAAYARWQPGSCRHERAESIARATRPRPGPRACFTRLSSRYPTRPASGAKRWWRLPSWPASSSSA